MNRSTRPLAVTITASALIFAAACGDSGGGAGTDAEDGAGARLTIGVQQPFSVLPVFVAEDQGFFEDHGIADVELTSFTDLPALAAALAQGQVDFALQTAQFVAGYNAQTQGPELGLFSPNIDVAFTWVAANDADVPPATEEDWETTVRAWEGKTIGVPALGAVVDAFTRGMLAEVGLDPETDVEIIAVAAGQPAVAALREGVADIVVGDAFGAAAAEQAGVGEVVLESVAGQGPEEWQDGLGSGYVTSETFAQDQPDVLADLSDALDEARAFITDPANAEEVQRILVERVQVDEATAAALYEAAPAWNSELTEESIQATSDVLLDYGAIAEPFTFEDVVISLEGAE